MRSIPAIVAALASAFACAADPSIYTGVSGAKLIDSGVFVVASGSGARQESFEYLQRPDGGFTLVNSITAANGSYRVNGRFDYDGGWNATAAHGVGIYDGVPAAIALERSGGRLTITVERAGRRARSAAVCGPSCLLDLAPSINPMFVMTRHYDFAAGGEQEFLWAGQNLDKPGSTTDDHVRMEYRGDATVSGPGGEPLKLRHFYFVENIPQPSGAMFRLDFDLWTDQEHRPLAFRVRLPGTSAVGTVGIRNGYERIRAQILPD